MIAVPEPRNGALRQAVEAFVRAAEALLASWRESANPLLSTRGKYWQAQPDQPDVFSVSEKQQFMLGGLFSQKLEELPENQEVVRILANDPATCERVGKMLVTGSWALTLRSFDEEAVKLLSRLVRDGGLPNEEAFDLAYARWEQDLYRTSDESETDIPARRISVECGLRGIVSRSHS